MRSAYLSRTTGFLTSSCRVVYSGIILSLLLGVTICGCGGTHAAVELPDPRQGKFLTIEEQQALKTEEIDTYCTMLNEYLDELRDEIAFATYLRDSLSTTISDLNGEHSALNREKRNIQKALRDKKTQRREVTEYITKDGDTLMTLSTLFYGSAAHWRKIFKANEDKVADPGKEFEAGITLKIPK